MHRAQISYLSASYRNENSKGKPSYKPTSCVNMEQHTHRSKQQRIFQSIVINISLHGAKIWPVIITVRSKIPELEYMRRCLQTKKNRMLNNIEIGEGDWEEK